jgi:hypothetical protein
MRTIVLTVLAAVGILSGGSLAASALPIDAASIGRLSQQAEPMIRVKVRKRFATAPCPTDQERSNRTGQCRPARSQGR